MSKEIERELIDKSIAEQKVKNAIALGNGELDLSYLVISSLPRKMDGIEGLKVLNVEGCLRLGDINGVRHHADLCNLNMNMCILSEDIDPLRGLDLRQLKMNHCIMINDFSPISDLSGLRDLNVGHCKISNLEFLSPLTELENLCLHNLDLVFDAGLLAGFGNIQGLCINGCTNLENFDFLSELETLTMLDIRNCPNFKLSQLPVAPELRTLMFTASEKIGDFSEISRLEGIETVSINGCASLKSPKYDPLMELDLKILNLKWE